jgi:hypothetical protein
MGVTISYEVVTMSEKKVDAIISKVKESAKTLGEKTKIEISEYEGKGNLDIYETEIRLKYVVDSLKDLTVVEEKPSLEFIIRENLKGKEVVQFPGGKEELKYWFRVYGGELRVRHFTVSTTGMATVRNGNYKYKGIMINPETTESITFVFVKINNLWVAKSFTKTQPFYKDEFQQNTFVHIWLASLLHEIEDQELGKVKVYDEGEFYETGRIEKLLENYGADLSLINEVARALTGKDLE